MAKVTTIKGFIKKLAAYADSSIVYNPWYSFDETLDISRRSYKVRQEQLEAYLLPRMGRSAIILVAEAIGYQGGRFTGIAMTCERMIMNHHEVVQKRHIFSEELCSVDTVREIGQRTSNPMSNLLNDAQRNWGFNEPTDTVVWGAIQDSQIDPFDVLLWNIFPFHPHFEGEPLSNRTPTLQEIEEGWQFMDAFLSMNPNAMILAIGKKAGTTLSGKGLHVPILRHPANGGAKIFKEQFRTCIDSLQNLNK